MQSAGYHLPANRIAFERYGVDTEQGHGGIWDLTGMWEGLGQSWTEQLADTTI